MSDPKYYIGWLDELPQRNKKAIRKLLIPIFLLLPVLALALVYFAEPSNDHQFDFGNVQSFTGVYHATPFPVLLLEEGQGQDLPDNHLLLVGYGKNGAKSFLPDDISGKRIRLRGTLIYGDGRALLELTDQEQSLEEVLPDPIISSTPSTAEELTLEGEILDPKCWFGVMKPAEGKVHKSCAIRCISGGIPPILRVNTGAGNQYYVLRGAAGEAVNEAILEYVGEPVTVKGASYEQNGWKVMHTAPETITYRSK